MSPRFEQEAAMDDMAEYAARLPRTENYLDKLNALSSVQLAVEADALAARMLGSLHTTRDFAIVQALIQRMRLLSMCTPSNREPLDGMLMLDLPDERGVAAPVLRFDGIERRHA